MKMNYCNLTCWSDAVGGPSDDSLGHIQDLSPFGHDLYKMDTWSLYASVMPLVIPHWNLSPWLTVESSEVTKWCISVAGSDLDFMWISICIFKVLVPSSHWSLALLDCREPERKKSTMEQISEGAGSPSTSTFKCPCNSLFVCLFLLFLCLTLFCSLILYFVLSLVLLVTILAKEVAYFI